jgi:hypothetical protein
MTLPSKYQNGSIDSSLKGVYRASPVKLLIYGAGMYNSHRSTQRLKSIIQEPASNSQM